LGPNNKPKMLEGRLKVFPAMTPRVKQAYSGVILKVLRIENLRFPSQMRRRWKNEDESGENF